jgi:hypothetical protein
MNETNTDVFIYTGEGGAVAPRDVVSVMVDPSVTSIPANAFFQCKKLAEVELCEGLVEIGEHSFRWCSHSITKINIPTSLRRINDMAFENSLRTPIRLHDDIESIGATAFANCIFTNFRVPPLITVIHNCMLLMCKSMFSLELPENVTEIGNGAFYICFCLRNVAFPPNVAIGDNIFIEEDADTYSDLQLLFVGHSDANIIWKLQHRFDGLPIHRLVYYQSYHQGVLQHLILAVNSGSHRTVRSTLDPTGNQQDCLGMTPLHILTCSSVHNIEVYRVIVEKYPTNLITEDRWGALPLLYAFWGAAPAEIIQFLLDSYQSLYPDHVFNWTMMVETMGRCDTPKENIENLLCVKQMLFPYQPIDWDYLLYKLSKPTEMFLNRVLFENQMRILFMCGMSVRMKALTLKVWREHIRHMIQTADFRWDGDNLVVWRRIQRKITHFEHELPKLKEVTTILELALWKMKMTMNENIHQEVMCSRQKKVRVDQSEFRRQSRVTCGADVIICHVMPYLIAVAVEESASHT